MEKQNKIREKRDAFYKEKAALIDQKNKERRDRERTRSNADTKM